MDLVEQEYNTAVAAVRFQTPYLHSVHRELLDHLVQNHEKVIIFLGISPLLNSVNNPLTFEQRYHMIREDYPDIIIMRDTMVADDAVWSKRLDKAIKELLTPNDTVVLYGGRKSALDQYSGKFPTRELSSDTVVSATELRRGISKSSLRSSDARAGIIWAASNRHPASVPTVDVAIWDDTNTRLLLGRKEHEDKWRFIGGYACPKSPSYEVDARREVAEETGLQITDPEYICSHLQEDWRYFGEQDSIKTLLYRANVLSGSPQPDDDIAALRWFTLDELLQDSAIERSIVTTHHTIMERGLNHQLKFLQNKEN